MFISSRQSHRLVLPYTKQQRYPYVLLTYWLAHPGNTSPMTTYFVDDVTGNESAFYDADTLYHAVTLTRWTWKFVVHQVSRDQSLQNLSEIEQSPAELLIILQIFAHVMTRSIACLGV